MPPSKPAVRAVVPRSVVDAHGEHAWKAFSETVTAAADLERTALIDLAHATNLSGWAPPHR